MVLLFQKPATLKEHYARNDKLKGRAEWCDSDEEYPKGYLSNILLTPRLLQQ